MLKHVDTQVTISCLGAEKVKRRIMSTYWNQMKTFLTYTMLNQFQGVHWWIVFVVAITIFLPKITRLPGRGCPVLYQLNNLWFTNGIFSHITMVHICGENIITNWKSRSYLTSCENIGTWILITNIPIRRTYFYCNYDRCILIKEGLLLLCFIFSRSFI